MSLQEGLEADCGRDRVQWCRLLTSLQEGPHQKMFFQKKIQNSATKMANCIIVDIVKYILLLLTTLSSSVLILIFFH